MNAHAMIREFVLSCGEPVPLPSLVITRIVWPKSFIYSCLLLRQPAREHQLGQMCRDFDVTATLALGSSTRAQVADK